MDKTYHIQDFAALRSIRVENLSKHSSKKRMRKVERGGNFINKHTRMAVRIILINENAY